MSEHKFGSAEFYDAIWETQWHDMERFNPTARHLERLIVETLATLEPLESLLDVGCGMGVNVKRVHRHFPDLRITGTDISRKSLEMAERYVGRSPLIDYVVLDAEAAPLPRTFDVVLCSQVLEHLRDDLAALRNLRQMCGRYLFLTVPGGAFNSTSRLVGHFRHYTKPELTAKVEEAGFEVLWAREWGFPFHSLYKAVLGLLPVEQQKRVGLGRYGFLKRLGSHALYALFHANRFDAGANIILLARPSPALPSPASAPVRSARPG